jgi:hypothetical protein
VREAERSGPESIGDDHSERSAQVEELAQQRNDSPRDAPPAGNPGGRDEHEPSHAFGVQRCELGGHDAAERVTGEVCTLDADGIQPSGQPAAERMRIGTPLWPREVDCIHAAVCGERPGDGRPPPPRPGETVNQHERLAGTGNDKWRRPSVDVDGAKLPLDPFGFGEHVFLQIYGRGATAQTTSSRRVAARRELCERLYSGLLAA